MWEAASNSRSHNDPVPLEALEVGIHMLPAGNLSSELHHKTQQSWESLALMRPETEGHILGVVGSFFPTPSPCSFTKKVQRVSASAQVQGPKG